MATWTAIVLLHITHLLTTLRLTVLPRLILQHHTLLRVARKAPVSLWDAAITATLTATNAKFHV
jgi:hypothetical protein